MKYIEQYSLQNSHVHVNMNYVDFLYNWGGLILKVLKLPQFYGSI